MTHIYKVSGMTCNGCKGAVEKTLSALPNIKDVSVHLDKAEVALIMQKHVDLEVLQLALSDKFLISEVLEANVFKSNASQELAQKTELQQLFPLFLIFSYILAAAVVMNINPWEISLFVLDFMGLFYIIFSFFKLLDLKGFPKSFKMYDPLAKVIPAYAWIYPFIEVALGLAFLTPYQIDRALVLTLIVLGSSTFGVIRILFNKTKIQCACLGAALKLPMIKAAFIENTVMLIMPSFRLFKSNAL